MCTMIAKRIDVSGAARGGDEWLEVDHAYVSFDHPFHLQEEHTLNLDFVSEESGPGARVSVELTEADARELMAALASALDQADRL
jgi:hypothetical protein